MTKSITLFYKLTQSKVINPPIRDLETKDRWIGEVQKTVEADWKPVIVKVQYTIFNPEIERQSRFFNGTVVKYYAIQNQNMYDSLPTNDLLKRYREEILDELLGYDEHLVSRVVRKRKSTTTYKTVSAWNKLLKLAEETLFDNAGYDFPDSKEFWELVKEHGYDEAERISIERLQKTIKSKLTIKDDEN